MTRLGFILGLILVFFFVISTKSVLVLAAAPTTPPNIIVIVTDDQDDMGSMAVMPKTRNLIGSQGLTFTNSFVDFSLCCPSRASFLTGQAAHNTGVLANGLPDGGYQKLQPTQDNSLPVWLQQAGYTTAHMGKYLNGFSSGSPIPPGWTLWNGIADDQGGYTYYNYTINENGVPHAYGNSPADYKTDVQAQKAADFIANQTGSAQPFFLWLAPFAQHGSVAEGAAGTLSSVPWSSAPAPRHKGLLSGLPLPQPPNFNEADMSDKPGFMQLHPLFDNAAIAVITDAFHGQRESLLAVDDMVERVVNALQNAGKLDNTIIVFTSDNGYSHGEHRRWEGKQLVYEESIRVPLMIRGPGIPAGQVRTQLVNNLDLTATIEDITGITPGRIPDGHSLVSLFQNASAPWRSSLLVQGMDKVNNGVADKTHLYGRFQAVRTNNYIYVEHNGTDFGSEKEFYDLIKDPYELDSRPNDPAYASVIADLKNRLNTLRTCAGVSCWMTTPEPSLPDTCAGVVCNSPPTHYCSGSNKISYINPGACNSGICYYNTSITYCTFGCTNGQCNPDPCAGVTCNSPPAPYCSGPNRISYNNPGTCNAGACSYTTSSTFCQFGCSGGLCNIQDLTNPCVGVICNSPPAQKCSDSTLTSFSNGACTNGICVYTANIKTCENGCDGNICKSSNQLSSELIQNVISSLINKHILTHLDKVNTINLPDKSYYYEFNGHRGGTILWIIPVSVPVTARIDPNTLDVISVQAPFWSFFVI